MLIYGDTLESQGFSFFTEVKISTTKDDLREYISTDRKANRVVFIGDNYIVAPNSLVVKDEPANVVVSGIPAQVIKKIN